MSPTFRSLHVRNYRLYAGGQLMANVGVWMQRVAQDWLVLELSGGSATALGITVGLQFLPMLLFSLWGGGLADRFRRRRMLMVTSSLLGITALLLGALVLTGLATLPLVLVMAFLVGSIAAIDSPARQAFVSEMVDVDDLPNAVALNTASFNLGRVFGPAAAGLLIAAVGTGWVFVINAAGYAFVALALTRVRVSELKAPLVPNRDGGNLREGLTYVRSRPDLMLVLAIAFFVGTFGLNFQLTIAAMVTAEFGLGAAAFGTASTVLAVGSLAGSLAAARRGAPRVRLVVLAALAFGAAAVTVSLMPTYVAFLFALPLVGVGALTLINAAQSFLQLNSEPELRGRVLGIYTLLFLGGTPLGSPLVGWVAETFGPRWSIALGGIVSALAALVVAAIRLRQDGLVVRAHLRPRPHLHIAEPDDLATTRPGLRLAGPSASSRALALPGVLLLALTGFLAPTAPAGEPTPGDADDLSSKRLAVVQDPRIDEASGMVVSGLHPDHVWIVNDSGGGELVYGVDGSGRTVAELTLGDIYNRDWEAMAPGVDDGGDPALWIADIGDNDAQWDSLRVYRISEPAELGVQDAPWRRVTLRYPDGAHNAEALLVDAEGRLFVVTKEAIGAGIYATPGVPEFGTTVTMERVGPAPMFVTDGAISPDGSQVALRTYTSLFLFDAAAFLSGGTRTDAGTVYPLPLQPQGETLAYTPDGAAVVVGTEGAEQPLYEITLPTSAPSAPAAADGDGSSRGPLLAAGIFVVVLIGAMAAGVALLRGRSGPRG